MPYLFLPPTLNSMGNILLDVSLLWNIVLKYLNHTLEMIPFSSSFILSFFISFVLKFHCMYSILLQLNSKPRDFNTHLHRFNLAFTLFMVSSTKKYCQQTNMRQDISPCIECIISFETTAKKKRGLRPSLDKV